MIAGGPAPLLAAWMLHTFNSVAPIVAYILLGAVVTVIATVLLPEPGREAVERELEGVREAVPKAVRVSRRLPAGTARRPHPAA